jgi:putative tryptophan/tyrosine transport system substrate-binding protein
MRRRDFIAALGGVGLTPLAGHAQESQRERVRRVGVLMNLAMDDPEAHARLGAFSQGMQEHGWSIGRNLRIEYRWAVGTDQIGKAAAELVALAPDVILVNATTTVIALQQASRSVPIVFASGADPVGMGIAQSLARPGGNATGFISAEFGLSEKWLELLKQIAPGVRRVAVFSASRNAGAMPQLAAVQTSARSVGVEVSPVDLADAVTIERGINHFGRAGNGGLVVLRLTEAIAHRDLIIALAAKHRLPAVYPLRFFVSAGGLMSYGHDIVDQYRHAAGYVDRILKGEKPANLPVQAPTKYELVINLRTAKALNIDVPQTLLARADEVIE